MLLSAGKYVQQCVCVWQQGCARAGLRACVCVRLRAGLVVLVVPSRWIPKPRPLTEDDVGDASDQFSEVAEFRTEISEDGAEAC